MSALVATRMWRSPRHGCLTVRQRRVAWGCTRLCELRRLLPGACLRQKAGRQGPRTPAQISQYAASPIRYGQPPQTAARLHG